MHPNYRNQTSSQILREFLRETVHEQTKEAICCGIDKVEEIKLAKKEVLNSRMSSLMKGKILNQLDEEIEELKEKMKKVIDSI